MGKITTVVVTVAVVAGIGALAYLWEQDQAQELKRLDTVQAPPPPAAPEQPTHYPVPEAAAEKALPPLERSDASLWSALSGLFQGTPLKKYLRPEQIARHVVITIDNLPRQTVHAQLRPTQPVPGAFRADGKGEELTISQDNAARYTPYVRIAEKVDSKELVALYTRFYPLFQQAYVEQGYPKGYFNDRLVTVIDHLLGAPEPEGPVRLVQPHVLYKYADPALEEESAGRKMMMRMGPENEKRMKAKLREIRSELLAATPPQSR